ncbi:MAG: hypothetical protein WC475_05145 [Candidatus Paceibacterota bacterium]
MSSTTTYTADCGKVVYHADSAETSLQVEMKKNYFGINFGICHFDLSKSVKYSISSNPLERKYSQNDSTMDIPKGYQDILSAVRKRMERGRINGGSSTFISETLDVYSDKKKKKVVIEDSSYNQERKLSVYLTDKKDELGGGLRRIEFFLLDDVSIPVSIHLFHRSMNKPIPCGRKF